MKFPTKAGQLFYVILSKWILDSVVKVVVKARPSSLCKCNIYKYIDDIFTENIKNAYI